MATLKQLRTPRATLTLTFFILLRFVSGLQTKNRTFSHCSSSLLEMSVEKDPFQAEEDEDEEVFSCKYCDFQTLDVDHLDDHIVIHEEAFLEDELDSDGQSDVSDGSFNQSQESTVKYSIKPSKQKLPAYFNEYASSGNKKVFVCAYCGYQTMKKADLDRHVENHREPVELPVYTCSECPYTTRRKCDMPKHLLTHCDVGTVPMHNCDKCSYSTKRKGDLSKHMVLHADVATLYKCDQCDYYSKRQGDLKKHLVCHELKQNDLFHCSECGYTSKRLNDLHKHVVLHCDRTVKGAFKCVKCDYASFAGNAFAKHLLSKCTVMKLQVVLLQKDDGRQEYVLLENNDGDSSKRNNPQQGEKRRAMGEYRSQAKRPNTSQFVNYKDALIENNADLLGANKVVTFVAYQDVQPDP